MNIDDLPEDLDETVRTMSKRLSQGDGHMMTQYEALKNDLQFTTAGNQWGENGGFGGARQANRPNLVSNQTLTICNRVVNAVRKNPFGINVSTDNQDVTELIQSKVRQIEYESRASESYENAFECAVIGGIGYYYITTEYLSDEDLDQKVSIKTIIDPTSVLLDPYGEEVDGSDVNWGFIRNYIDRDTACEEHGDEVIRGTISGFNIYESYNVPPDSVAQLIYYYKESKMKMRYWLQDGSFTDKKPEFDEMIVGKRKVSYDKVYCCEFIGNKFISKTEVGSKFIPIVPVYGDRLRTYGEDIYWGGMTRRVKDSQRMVNYYKSNEAETVALIPKSPYIAEYSQIEKYREIWENANTEPYAVLPYDGKDINGSPLPPPQRAANVANTGGIVQSRIQAQQDMALESGVFINQLGGQETAGQSGKAILLRDGQGEITNAQYLDNYKKSMNQAGRIVLAMIKTTSDTMRNEAFRSEDGEVQYQNVNLSELIGSVNDLDVTVSAGPAYENARKEAISTINELISGNPQLSGVISDLMIKNMDAPGSKEIAKRLYKALPPEFKDEEEPNAPDPEAMQALQAQEATIQELEATLQKVTENAQQVIGELRNEIISSDRDNQTKILTTKLQEESDLAQAELKAQVELAKAGLQEEAKNFRELESIKAKAVDKMATLAGDVIKNQTEAVEVEFADIPNPPTPGGDIDLQSS